MISTENGTKENRKMAYYHQFNKGKLSLSGKIELTSDTGITYSTSWDGELNEGFTYSESLAMSVYRWIDTHLNLRCNSFNLKECQKKNESLISTINLIERSGDIAGNVAGYVIIKTIVLN
jgi:hypothetical protein